MHPFLVCAAVACFLVRSTAAWAPGLAVLLAKASFGAAFFQGLLLVGTHCRDLFVALTLAVSAAGFVAGMLLPNEDYWVFAAAGPWTLYQAVAVHGVLSRHLWAPPDSGPTEPTPYMLASITWIRRIMAAMAGKHGGCAAHAGCGCASRPPEH